MSVPNRPRLAIAALVLLALAAGLALLLAGRGGSSRATARGCAPGYTRPDRELAERLGRHARGACISLKHPESFADLADMTGGFGLRTGTNAPRAYGAALRDRAAVARQVGLAPHGRGVWRPVGKGPLIANDPAYTDTFGEGFVNLAGRISEYALDTRRDRLIASVASGGVWESADRGVSWRPIGDRLPTQTIGAVAYTPASGGTIVALTGDNSFGAYTYAGVGAYWTSDGGRSWHRARGIPDGALGFRVAVDPGDPRVLYAATGVGLYRSADAGRSWTNVVLPTGPCAGNSFRTDCFLANVVTDVVVQGADRFGHGDGAVLAVVGWRVGALKNNDGSLQSPANGLYRSVNGQPHSFARESAPGFTPQTRIGRVALGIANGPAQNHGYVYAVVQDAQLMRSGKLEGLDLPDLPDPLGLGINLTDTPTNLNGIYVSRDFGAHWTEMESAERFLLPTNGSALAPLAVLGYGPGIQSWYNAWVSVDPTRASNGVPTRVALGLEEIFQNTLPLPQNGLSDFKAIAPYSAGSGACILTLATPLCNALQKNHQQTTAHPDQHAAIWLPDGHGGVTLVAGNDGGNYVQHVAAGRELTQTGFGAGAQQGFHTLLPYGVTVARDGVVYAGLQDNGELRIDRDGTQHETYGGDGVFTVVDPADSNIAYEETPEAGTTVTVDGGRNWRDMLPNVTNPSFYTPLVMDPLNAKHLLTGGREVAETIYGPETEAAQGSSNHWALVYDTGTQHHPGDADATPTKADPANQISAAAVRGPNAYAAFCVCDPVRDHTTFTNGIATNVGGGSAPKAMAPDGWHIAAAKGLPRRIVTSVLIDPQRPSTIYATLGSSSERPYAPPGATGADGLQASGGNVYESTDAGASFHDISGNLPRIGAGWAVLHGRQLVVATTVGVFASTTRVSATRARRLRFGILGRSLPAAPVFSMQIAPSDPNLLYVASFGRGVYRYRFTR